MAPELILSLRNDEKKLIDDFYSTFQKSRPAPHLNVPGFRQFVFGQWVWAQKVQREIEYVMYEHRLFHLHEGNREKCWKLCLTRLKSVRAAWDSQYSKVPRLEGDNSGFSKHWLEEPEDEPSLCLAEEDLPYWAKITTMYICRLLQVSPFSDFASLERQVLELSIAYPTENIEQTSEDNPSISTKDSERANPNHTVAQTMPDWSYEIWELVHMCSIYERSAIYRHLIWDALRQCDFEDLYAQIKDKFVRKDFEAEFPQSQAFLVSDPVDYIEFIPWNDLEPCFSCPNSISGAEKRFGHWISSIVMKYDHHLHPNVATFRFCVENDNYFPGHLHRGKVSFIFSPLKESGFVRNLHSFWKCWNDCAITRETETGKWFLLETIPGHEFRQVFYSTDMFSAVKYFCRKIDRIRFDSDKLLRGIMGPYFDASYEGVLEPIPVTQITSVCPKPLGEGERGIVYKATWSCPQKMSMPASENITVAVKAIKTKDRGNLNRFFKELKANIITLQGSSVSCVRCFGISKTRARQSSSKDLEPSTESGSLSRVLPPDTFLLVMEYAKDGFLTKYLLKTLNGDISDWPRIRDILIDLTVCIFELHEVGIIHRDLHENNVLIGADDTSMDEDALERPALKVSDLGESALSELKLQGGTYGDRNVWAPEVIRGRNYSKASDIYAMGSIMEKTVSLQWEISLSKLGIKTTMTPKFIVDVMRWCHQPKASDRPSAEEASSALGDHTMETEFEMEEVDPDKIFNYEEETESNGYDENEEEIPT